VLGADEAACLATVKAHLDALPGARVLETVRTTMRQDPETGATYEPFGFRDGVSQPVILGTGRGVNGAPERDRLAPGEFILGYPDGEALEGGARLFPPAILVSAATDLDDDLPSRAAETPLEYPDFSDDGPQPQLRDLGRNGAFLAVRRLRQDVAAFKAYTEAEAQRLAALPAVETLTGEPVTADWVAAKMVGRRRDGTPMIGGAPGDNDFDHGTDDPRGLACPLGAHIRRANPRTSLHPDNPVQQSVTNRRRLLRRGRAYHTVDDAEGTARAEEGLLFMAVCADLERQFEFVQQTWLGGPAFHRLDSEMDPVICGGPGFTIPTPAGHLRLRALPDFVSVQAGGYFFLPSRSALRYLSRLC
jgi:Dyp-type peroxidase family